VIESKRWVPGGGQQGMEVNPVFSTTPLIERFDLRAADKS